jgi:integrase
MSYAERRAGKLTGWWYADAEFTQPNGAVLRLRKRFQRKGEADGYEAYVRATGQEPPGSTEAPAGSFRMAADAFLARNPAWGSRDNSARQRMAWVCDYMGTQDVKTITTPVLDKLVDKLLATPGRAGERRSNRTVNHYLNAVAVVLGFAHERGMITAVPKIPRLPNKGADREAVLSYDMEDAVCRWLETHKDPRCAFVVRVLTETGMRRAELWKLRPEQVGNETITLDAEQTKTGATRKVPVPVEMATQLRAMVAARSLPNADHVYRAFKEAVKACGGDPELCLHSLRHTRGTRLMEANVDVRIIAQLLGHKVLQTTMRYTHPNDDVLAEAAKKVHQLRGPQDEKGVVIDLGARKSVG